MLPPSSRQEKVAHLRVAQFHCATSSQHPYYLLFAVLVIPIKNISKLPLLEDVLLFNTPFFILILLVNNVQELPFLDVSLRIACGAPFVVFIFLVKNVQKFPFLDISLCIASGTPFVIFILLVKNVEKLVSLKQMSLSAERIAVSYVWQLTQSVRS